jgi:hypothetical protein
VLALDLLSIIGFLLAWVGWGSLLAATLVRDAEVDWGQKAAWGVALAISVGGVLELTCMISRPLILTLLAIGWALWAVDVGRRRLGSRIDLAPSMDGLRRHRIATAILAAVLAVVVLRVAASAVDERVNIHDDHHAYLVFPVRMLDTGCLGNDPFNHRRLVSSLGGKSFLDTFTMSVATPYNLHITDAGLGLILVLGLLQGRFRRRGVAALPAAAILLFVAAIPPPQVNMTALMLGTALLLSLYRTLDEWPESANVAAATVVIALTTAAIVALKNQLVPAVACTLALSYLFYIRNSGRRRQALAQAAACAALVGLLVLPWMLSLWSSSGTMFYGLLGSGVARYDLVAELRTPAKTLELLWAAARNRDFLLLVALLPLTLWRVRGISQGRAAALAMAFGNVLAAVVVVVVTTAPARNPEIGAQRYCFPFLFAAILVLLVKAVESPEYGGLAGFGARPWTHSARAKAVTVLAALLVLSYSPWAARSLVQDLRSVDSGLRGTSRQAAGAIRALQESVPPGESLLARLEEPFLLDFSRNPVQVVDHPGMVSPTPGMPIFEGGEALAGYLLESRIRYVAFSYKSEANYSIRRFRERLKHSHSVQRAVAAHVFAFNESLQDLGRTRKRIYDDGEMWVLDLAQRRESPR